MDTIHTLKRIGLAVILFSFLTFLTCLSLQAQFTYYVYQGTDSVEVTLEDPFRHHLELDEYFCYFWTDVEGNGYWNMDFDGNGVVNTGDLILGLSLTGGQIGFETINKFEETGQYGNVAQPYFDVPDLNVFEMMSIQSSGARLYVPDEYEHLVYENRVETFPNVGGIGEDIILQYTQSDEYGNTFCPNETCWSLCLRTFKIYVFLERDGINPVESYYFLERRDNDPCPYDWQEFYNGTED